MTPNKDPLASVDRCACVNRRFAELLHLARAWDYDLACLAVLTGAGSRCGNCRAALATWLDARKADAAGATQEPPAG